MHDIRDEILASVVHRKITASILADDGGILAETAIVAAEAENLGLNLLAILSEGTMVGEGDEIARFYGSPKQVVMAEEVLIGLMAKPSGMASVARRFVEKAGKRLDIVCGAWKKLPLTQKESIRRSVVVGGAYYRISREPFVYLDKNYVQMLGGIKASLEAVSNLEDRVKVVQLKGRYKEIEAEACDAVACGASILSIDTGCRNDVKKVVGKLVERGLREKVSIAFSGGVSLEDMDELKTLDIDILDIGRKILDAPLLDMRLEVTRID